MILPFHPSHLENLEPVEGPLPAGFIDIAELYARLGPAVTLEHQGQVLACGGVVLTGPNQGRAWAVVSRESHQFPITLTRTALCTLQGLETAGLERVTIIVDKKHQPAICWARFLGFRTIPNSGENLGSTPHIIFERRNPCPGTLD